MKRFYLPLAIFVPLIFLLFAGLKIDPDLVPSPLIGKAAPGFSLPQLQDTSRRISPQDFRGQVWVLNVWASWCTACVEEHPRIMRYLKDEVVLVGLNYKDQNDAAREWLENWGDPYTVSIIDSGGRAGLDWGVYGVPETFVIDKEGKIRYKHIGPLANVDIIEHIIPLVRRLNG